MADIIKINNLHHLETVDNGDLSNLNGGVSVGLRLGVFFPTPKIDATTLSLDASLGLGLAGGGSIGGGVFPTLTFSGGFS